MYKIEEEIELKVKQIVDYISAKESVTSKDNLINNDSEVQDYDSKNKKESKSDTKNKGRKDTVFNKLRKELIDLLLSEKVIGSKYSTHVAGETVLHVEFLNQDIPLNYYKTMLEQLLFKKQSSIQDYKKNYLSRNNDFFTYLKDRVFKMTDVDLLAREWAISLDEKPYDERAKYERDILKNKICNKFFDESVITKVSIENPYIICRYFGKVNYEVYTDVLLEILNENKDSRYKNEKNSSFSMYFRKLLLWRTKTKEAELHSMKQQYGLTSRGPNKRENNPIYVVSIDQESEEHPDFLETHLVDELSMEERSIGYDATHEILIDILTMLNKIMAFGDSKADKKRKKIYYASFTFELIKNTEKEKVDGEIDETDLSTGLFLSKSEEFMKFVLLSFVIMLKGGVEKDYLGMYEVIQRSIIRKDLDFSKYGIKTALILEHLLDEIGSEATVRKYIKDYEYLLKISSNKI